MTGDRRHSLAVAIVAIVAGIGLGAELAVSGLPLATNVGLWAAALGGGALLLIFILSPAKITLPDETPSTTVNESAWAEFRRELRRSRRGARPLTLLRMPGPELLTLADLVELEARSRRLTGHLRLVDRAWVDDGSIYILLPESPREAAEIMLGRIRTADPKLLTDDIRAATFPDDGLTSGALIAAIHGSSIANVPTPIRAALLDHSEPVFEEVTPPVAEALP